MIYIYKRSLLGCHKYSTENSGLNEGVSMNYEQDYVRCIIISNPIPTYNTCVHRPHDHSELIAIRITDSAADRVCFANQLVCRHLNSLQKSDDIAITCHATLQHVSRRAETCQLTATDIVTPMLSLLAWLHVVYVCAAQMLNKMAQRHTSPPFVTSGRKPARHMLS